jgi:uncharacterized FlaG/YvyC family protein
MRIDGPSPTEPVGSRPVAREATPAPVRQAATPVVKDHVETHQKVQVSSTNVLVEMQPGNIVVYKFIDEASGKLIQQIPSEQMLNLARLGEEQSGEGKTDPTAKDKKS